MGDPILRARGIRKAYPGVLALDGVDLELERGEIRALAGENGAGKSTLVAVLSGVVRPDAGEIELEGLPAAFRSPQDAAAGGIAVVHQELSVAPNRTVAENIFAGREPAGRLGIVRRRVLLARAREVIAEFGTGPRPEAPLAELGPGDRQVVEILKAFALRPKVLLLDEPTSSLARSEARRLFDAIRRLRAQGMAMLFISHHLPEIFDLADRVTVLRDGRLVGTRPIGDVDEAALVRMMVGREIADVYGRRTAGIGWEPALRVQGLTGPGFRDVSFRLRRGEIVALAGLVGAGRTELARALFGAAPIAAGAVEVGGRAVRIRSPRDAIRAGLAYMTEDRSADGLFLDMAVAANVTAPSLGRFSRGGLVRDGAAARFASGLCRRFRVATRGIRQAVRELSGGNRQKVLLATWAGAEPRVLLADEPTRGVDVGAKLEIYGHLRALAAQGVAILLISSDLPEVLGMSDRILVMRAGAIVAGFPAAEATEERVIAAAIGAGEAAP